MSSVSDPRNTAITITPPNAETKILSRRAMDKAQSRERKMNQSSIIKTMIHGLNRTVRIWAAIIHIKPVLFHVENAPTSL